jgi:hypothetical protein
MVQVVVSVALSVGLAVLIFAPLPAPATMFVVVPFYLPWG